MTTHLASLPDTALVIDRARLKGRGDRQSLQQALTRTSLDGLGMMPGEILLIPRLSMKQRLASGGVNLRFAQSLSRSLREALEKAALDPSHGVDLGAPVRFSSQARLAAWLMGNRDMARHYLPGLIADMPGVDDLDSWVERVLLPDGPALAQCAKLLFERGQLAVFLRGLNESDLATASNALRQSYSVSVNRLVRNAENSLRREHAEIGTERAVSLAMAPMSSRLAAEVAAQMREAPLSREAIALGTALVWCAAFPSASRKLPLDKCVAAILQLTSAARTKFSDAAEPNSSTAKEPEPFAAGRSQAVESFQPVADCQSERVSVPHAADRSERDHEAMEIRSATEPGVGLEDDETTPNSFADRLAEKTAPPFGPSADTVFASPFCGLLFLNSLLREIGVVADFGLNARAGLDLAPFALVDRLGVHWFGRAYQKSALHDWLASEAATIDLPKRFVHPDVEAGQLERGCGRIFRDGRYMTVWHDWGYPLLDLPRTVSRQAIVQKLGRGVLQHGRICRAAPRQRLPQSQPDRWIGALAKLVEAEMRRRGGGYDLTPQELAMSATVRVVDGTITASFDLSDLPFPVRFSGLDRDPGWIEQEGRSLAFIFT